MKRLAVFVLITGVAVSLFAQTNVPEYRFVGGGWGFTGPRLYQNDEKAELAKVNFRVLQSGRMIYEFDARYEGGAEDGHGGFGLHIFADSAYNAASWGAGKSYLFWLNYDEAPASKDIPRGLSGQIYRSISNSRMELVESIPLNQYHRFLTDENLAASIPFKIEANGNTGEIRIYDPTDPDEKEYFLFTVDSGELPLKGDWVVLRTNGMKLSFDVGKPE